MGKDERDLKIKNGDGFDSSLDDIDERLAILLEANARIAASKAADETPAELEAAAVMRRPLDSATAYSSFGLALGLLPTTALLLNYLMDTVFRLEGLWFILPFSVASIATGVTGWLTGGVASRTVEKISHKSISQIALLLPLAGAGWGAFSGAVGGLFFYGIGALPGSIVGAAVGTVALPLFAFFHNLLKSSDKIETKHLLPVALGISLTIAAFFLSI